MNISVIGGRVIPADWDAVRDMPDSGVPPLTAEQRVVAQQLRIAEIDYARSSFAIHRTQERLLVKVEAFARLLGQKVRERDSSAEVETVTLRTTDQQVEIVLVANRQVIPLCIDEDLVNDLLEKGAADADSRLEQIVERVIPGRAA